nr:MAG TPA: tail collar fiber protein [Caudoviricetes sp.]
MSANLKTMVFDSIITDIGFDKINEALISGSKLDLKYIALGDSCGEYYEPKPNQISLVNEIYRAEVQQVDGISATALIPFNVGGFFIREVGVFDSENNLILVAPQPLTYKPQEAQGGIKDIWIKFRLKGVNPDAIEIKIDASIQYASVEFVTDLIKNHKHPDLMPIWLYDTNGNGVVDSCEFVDGGLFTDNSDVEIPLPPVLPDLIMNTSIYDKNQNGIVDDAENIDAGEF